MEAMKRLALTSILGLALLAPGLAAASEQALPRPRVWVPGIPHVMQMNNYSCGTAVFQAVAQRFGHEAYQETWAKELGTDPEEGTHPAALVEGLRDLGLEVELVEGMSLESLLEHIRRRDVVIVDFQAWGDAGTDYSQGWEDGHYALAVGYSDHHLFLEDPSILGSIGYLTLEDFEARWHDYENEAGGRREYRHMAIVVRGPAGGPPTFLQIE